MIRRLVAVLVLTAAFTTAIVTPAATTALTALPDTPATTVALAVAEAPPAQAHARNCGHSTSGVHWAPDATGWHRVRFVRHWDEVRQGVRRHMHNVRRYTVAGFPYGLSAFHSC